jgi:hypothetical protein
MVYTTWKIRLIDPLGKYVRSVKICLDIDGFDIEDPCILNHPYDLLEELEELSESHSIDYQVVACPNTLEFVSLDDEEYELDPLWTGTWSSLTLSSDIVTSDDDDDSSTEIL